MLNPINIIILLGTFLFMEFVAWSVHKYLMHGLLWNLHEDHHAPSGGFFQKNDFFFLIFAVPSFLCILFGTLNQIYPLMALGFGIMLYGFAYFTVHEVLIHRRFKWFGKTQNLYLKSILYAHRMHHSHIGKYDGESFGMLFVHPKYIRHIINESKKQQILN